MPTTTTTAARSSFTSAAAGALPSARQLFDRARLAIRAQVRPLGQSTRGTVAKAVGAVAGKVGRAIARPLGRLGALAERYVGTKIKRRVKPPILAALLIAGVALAVAGFALARK